MESPSETNIDYLTWAGYGGIWFSAIYLLRRIYVHLRDESLVNVNCWFCNINSKVLFKRKNEWFCPHCDQFNGFTEDGDYSRIIPEQHDETLNPGPICVSTARKNDSERHPTSNGLCHLCNCNQEVKVRQLACYVPYRESNYDEEIEEFRAKLEKAYKLCDRCEDVTNKTLHLKTSLFGASSRHFYRATNNDSFTKRMLNVRNIPPLILISTILVFLSELERWIENTNELLFASILAASFYYWRRAANVNKFNRLSKIVGCLIPIVYFLDGFVFQTSFFKKIYVLLAFISLHMLQYLFADSTETKKIPRLLKLRPVPFNESVKKNINWEELPTNNEVIQDSHEEAEVEKEEQVEETRLKSRSYARSAATSVFCSNFMRLKLNANQRQSSNAYFNDPRQNSTKMNSPVSFPNNSFAESISSSNVSQKYQLSPCPSPFTAGSSYYKPLSAKRNSPGTFLSNSFAESIPSSKGSQSSHISPSPSPSTSGSSYYKPLIAPSKLAAVLKTKERRSLPNQKGTIKQNYIRNRRAIEGINNQRAIVSINNQRAIESLNNQRAVEGVNNRRYDMGQRYAPDQREDSSSDYGTGENSVASDLDMDSISQVGLSNARKFQLESDNGLYFEYQAQWYGQRVPYGRPSDHHDDSSSSSRALGTPNQVSSFSVILCSGLFFLIGFGFNALVI